MTEDELIHLISNQALNQNVKEQHKLVIQDCCKELFKKKCDKPYKIVEYEVIVKPHSKPPTCKYCGEPLMDCHTELMRDCCSYDFNPYQCDCGETSMNYSRTRVMMTDRDAGSRENPICEFPRMILEAHIEEFKNSGIVFLNMSEKTYVIKSIKDI